MRIANWEPVITPSDHNPQESSESGGARGALTADALANIIDDTERVRAAFTSPTGVTRIGSDARRRVSVPVVMVVTDRRVLFVARDAEGNLQSAPESLPYEDVAAVTVEDDDGEELVLSLADGVRWEFPLPDADPTVVDSVVSHLRWVGELRSRLVACRNDLELAAGEIREAAAEMEWETAEEAYEGIRSRLDGLIGAVHWTEPIPDEVIAPELTGMERTLESAHARLFIERAESRLELGRQLVENEDYEQAGDVLDDAERYYERAADRADCVRRGDDFRFGEQRELRADLDRLEWEIDAVAAEPLRQAHEAKVSAANTADPTEAVAHWEDAFRRYDDVLTLEWGEGDRQFAGDREAVREERAAAADRLVECHRELARDRWDRGVDHERDGETKAALRTCETAVENMERAADLAEEFRADEAERIRRRHRDMCAAVRSMRETATVDTDDETAEPAATDAETSGATEDIADIDTHHEITLDMNIDEQAAGDGRQVENEDIVAELEAELKRSVLAHERDTDG